MASHFSCIGIDAKERTFGRRIGPLLERGERLDRPDGGTMLRWEDPAGPRLVANLDGDGAVACVTPSFAASAPVRVVPERFTSDPECRFCDPLLVEVVDDEGVRAYPLAVQIEDIGTAREAIRPGTPTDAVLAGFAEQIGVWPDEDTYLRSQPEDRHIAAESVVPAGLLPDDDDPRATPTPHVLMTGRVLTAERRRNTGTGKAFQWALLQTHGGRYEVVASRKDLRRTPQPDNIVQGIFWMVGRITS